MRAIILAAGMGTRLRPLTLTKPKSLLTVNGESLVERQIRFLKEKGIDDIILVTGYLAEQFQFLNDKYDVKLVHNEKYAEYNNFYTMYLVRDYLSDSYVIDADNYLADNFFESKISESTYFSSYKSRFENEWLLEFDQQNQVINICVTNGEGYILSGISYWDRETGSTLKRIIEDYYLTKNYKELYWDNVVMENLDKLTVSIKKLPQYTTFEIDNVRDLEELNNYFSGLVDEKKQET